MTNIIMTNFYKRKRAPSFKVRKKIGFRETNQNFMTRVVLSKVLGLAEQLHIIVI